MWVFGANKLWIHTCTQNIVYNFIYRIVILDHYMYSSAVVVFVLQFVVIFQQMQYFGICEAN